MHFLFTFFMTSGDSFLYQVITKQTENMIWILAFMALKVKMQASIEAVKHSLTRGFFSA